MRILALADAMFSDKPGGSKRVALEVERRLAARGHSVTALVPRTRPDLPLEEVIDGIRVVRYAFTSPLALVWAGYWAARRLHAAAPFDAIYAHFAYASAGPLLALPRVPVLRAFYGPWADEARVQDAARPRRSLQYKMMAAVERWTLERAGQVAVLSAYSREQLETDYAVPAEKITLIPGGVDTERFRPPADTHAARAALGLPADRPLLLSVRRLVPRMGLENLIAAMPAVVARYPQALLLIGGKGPLAPALEAQIQALGLQRNVRLLGFIPDETLPRYYQSADVFALPTAQLEGFGLITLEALACGAPVVATPVGSNVEVVNSLPGGYLCADATPAAIAAGLVRCLHAGGRAVLNAPAAHAHLARHYDWARITQRTEAALLAVTAGRAAPEFNPGLSSLW